MFVGRREELQFLEDRYNSKNGQLIVLYGRRRVGKTETLKKFCEGKPHVFYSCTECPDEKQLTSFSERMLQKGMEAAKYIRKFQDWNQALKSVADLPFEEKKLLVIDEFPYMVRSNASIPSILQNLWDEQLKNENVMIILCGSAMSFMEKEILAEKNPLYGRATGILKMNEMGFYDAIKFVENYSPEEKIVTYAVLGGLPHYLKQFDDQLSLEENICKHILTRGSILYSEVEFLMKQEFRETATYNAIIEAIALGNTKLNEIHQKTQIEKTKLSAYLKNLTDIGIIRREFPTTDRVKEQANVQRGLYQVNDAFFKFWYAFVFPNMSELENGDVDGIWKYAIEPEMNFYVSYMFEDICRQYLRKMNRENKLPFHFTKIGRWWDKAIELDILAMDTKKEKFMLGECKYKNSNFSYSDFQNMKEKFQPQKRNSEIYYYLFSKSGFSGELQAETHEYPEVRLIDLDTVVNS